jgi:hypothetical protein
VSARLPARRSVLLAAVALAMVPAAALAATPKKFGFYFAQNAKSQQSLTIGVNKHKITNGSATLKFKKNGKLCAAPGASVAGPIGVSFSLTKHPVTPSSSGAFSFKTSSTGAPLRHAAISVSGLFTSSKSARITVKSSFRGCKGKYSVRKTQFSLGG